MSYQHLFVFFDIHSKYILPINKGSEKQTVIHLRGYEATGSPEMSNRTLIFSSDKTHKKKLLMCKNLVN